MSNNSAEIERYFNKTYLQYYLGLNLRKHNNLHFGYSDGTNQSIPASITAHNKALVDFSGIQNSVDVLDAGCGVGGSSIWLAKHYEARVTGVTNVRSQQVRASNLARKNKLNEQVRFIYADFTQIPFSNNSFDVVWAVESVCYAQNKNDFIVEALRVLKPGGKLVVADGFLSEDKPASRREILDIFKGWLITEATTIASFTKQMENNGFKNIHQKNVSKNVMRFSKWLRDTSVVLYPIAWMLTLLRIRSTYDLGNIKTSIRQYPALVDDKWCYCFVVGTKPK